MPKFKAGRILTMAALCLALVACAGAEEPQAEEPQQVQPEAEESPEVQSQEGRTVDVRAVETGPYEGVPDEIPAGSVEFVFLNADADAPHNFIIEELEVGTDRLAPNETDEFTVDLEPGTYTFYCSVPGHRQAGMEGRFEVVDG